MPTRKLDAARLAPHVAIIGAGRLGTALALALARLGYPLTAVVTRTAPHARRAHRLITTHAPQTSPSLALDVSCLAALPQSELYIFATPDDQLHEAAAELAAIYEAPTSVRANKRPIALHLSGARTHDELAPLRAHKFHLGSCHPLISVSDPVQGSHDLRQAFFAIEGDRPATSAARRLVTSIGGRVLQLDTRHKTLYHLAAVITSGHTVALFSIAVDLLKQCGIDNHTARQILLPLLHSTVQNLTTQIPSRALTGSFARFDSATIKRHLAALTSHDKATADIRRVYALLGTRALELALEQQTANPSGEAVREIKVMLEAAMLKD